MTFAAFPLLAKAYELKEYYINMNNTRTIDTAPEMLSSAVSVCENSGIEEVWIFCHLAYKLEGENHKSFTIVGKERINNSHIESKNKTLEHIMYNAYGFSNFKRTRNTNY